MEPMRLKIENLSSAGSPMAVENALLLVPGVMRVHIDHKHREIRVEAGENVQPDELVAAAQKAGCVATVVG